MMNITRNHYIGNKQVVPIPGLTTWNCALCMHFGYPLIHEYQTTATMIVQLKPTSIVIWVTGTAAPCLSIFKPLWFEALPSTPLRDKSMFGSFPSQYFDAQSLW